jgi:steroid delta-isomerase-like uncharacterized protein
VNQNRQHAVRTVEIQHSQIWSQGRLDLVSEIYTPDFVGHFPAGIVRGHSGIRDRIESHRKAFPDWSETVVDMIVDGNKVVTRFISRGTNLGPFLGNPPTGNRVEVSEVAIFRLADGKIAEQWVYPDMRTLQRQLTGDED